MSWLLTTPIAVGALDTAPYAEVLIVRQSHDSVRGFIMLNLEYGNTDGYGVWHPGMQPRGLTTFVQISGADYATLVTGATPVANEKTYDAVKRALYLYMASKSIIGAGTIK